MKKLFLIDGNSLVNRAFYALPPMNAADGRPTQAVYGFVGMLIKLFVNYKPEYMAVAFDLPKPTFRHVMYPEYKATRKGMPEELAVQLPILKEVLQVLGIAIVESQGFEADDIIGTIASTKTVEKFIVTGDKDSLQLIDKTTTVMLTKRGLSDIAEMTPSNMLADFGLLPSQVVDFKALAGDSSDNIPGVPGIGEKGAISLLTKYGTLDQIYENIAQIGGKLGEKLVLGRESAYLSRQLATIDRDVPLSTCLADYATTFPFPSKAKFLFSNLSFGSHISKDIWQGSEQTAVATTLTTIDQIEQALKKTQDLLALHIEQATVHFSYGEGDYVAVCGGSLLDPGLDAEAVIECLRPYLENGDIIKVMMDCKDSMHLFDQKGIALNEIFDVRLAQYLIDAGKAQSTLGQLLTHYGLPEQLKASGLLALRQRYLATLEELDLVNLYFDIELPLVRVLFEMERQGFAVDIGALTEVKTQYQAELEMLTKQVYAIAKQEFNLNSPKQLAKVLFEDLGINYPTRSKNYSTAVEILEQLDDQTGIVPLILHYRSIMKLQSTYVDGLLRLQRDGVVHTEFRQTLTATGRLSSVEPNLQNIPIRKPEGRKLRKVFVAKDDHVLVSADYSQIELRLMAHLSGDPTMISAYNRGTDIHKTTAAQVFGVPIDSVTSDQRRAAKAVNFGIIYGISDYGLAKDLKISAAQARDYIDRYFETYPMIRSYLDRVVADAFNSGFVRSMYGRIRHIPELKGSPAQKSFGMRAAMNMPMQASAADIIKIAMIAVSKRLRKMRSKLILQVHDELVIEAHQDEVEQVVAILHECMEAPFRLSVPLVVDINIGKDWYKE